jgi:hypothetical protein
MSLDQYLQTTSRGHIMLRDLLTQKFVHKFLDTPEYVDSEKLNRQIDLGPALYQLFSKRDFYFIKCAKH